MLWQGRQGSSNVDDRRGISGGRMAAGGGIIGVIVLLLNFFLGGGDSSQLPDVITQGTQQQQQEMNPEQRKADSLRAKFVTVVLKDTEDIWGELFQKKGMSYVDPTMVLFTQQVESACGGASSATGPFYCPGDQKLYIDLSFYEELSRRFNAPGDFAMAYVVAHEVGHHVQTLLGTTEKVAQLRGQMSKSEYNKYSVKVELQADFYAGVWAHYEKNRKNAIEEGDIEEALNAANAIGDDRLQQESQGHVVPDAFTHGTSQQRMYWFKKGFDTGDMDQGNTFSSTEQ